MFANLSPLIATHFAAALIALPLGLIQLAAAKGTPGHRRLGYLYILVMLVTNVSALLTWPERRFPVFFLFVIVSLSALASGMWSLRRWFRTGDANSLRRHKIDMGYSWLGLLMAGTSQFLVNPRFGIAPDVGPVALWGLFAALNLILYAAGSWLIFNRLARS
ncbi:DUF2306 domain-containing protein [Thermaurantiacus sp.]